MSNQQLCIHLSVSLLVLAVVVLPIRPAIAGDGKAGREVGRIELKKLSEISGVAASRKNADILWVHNDGSSQLVFAVHTSGKLAAVVGFPIEIEDFEDIAIGPGPDAGADYIYVGDIGDNDKRRHEIRIVRFAEPQLSEAGSSRIEIESAEEFRLTYPDGPHNAEALIVDPSSGDTFIVTKERKSKVYRCPGGRVKDRARIELEVLATLKIDYVSGGAVAHDGSHIILRREEIGWLWNRGRGQDVADALRVLPQEIPVRGRAQGSNGEAVSFSPDGRSYFTVSEGKQQAICEFSLPGLPFVPDR